VSAPGSAECAPWAARSRLSVREVATVARTARPDRAAHLLGGVDQAR
jgi:hypothetical protein